MRLIDADTAHEFVKQYTKSDEEWACTGGTAIRLMHNLIDAAPTVDAVPVVRCCRCRFGESLNDKSVLCYHPSTELDLGVKAFPNDFFCKYGDSGAKDEHGA